MTSQSVDNSQNDNRSSPSSSQPSPPEQVSFREWIGVIAAALAAFMSTFVVQSSIPSIQNIAGDLGVPLSLGAWVLYGSLIAQIISVPVAGFFSKVFSVRRYFLVSICLFPLACAASGLVTSFPLMIMTRACQGFLGGGLNALALIVIVTQLPPAKRPIGLVLNSVSLALAPGIAPDIGGWITYNYSWHYVSFLPLIPGALAFAGGYYGLKREPRQLQLLKRFDWLAMFLYAVGVTSFIFVIQIGTVKNWFDYKPVVYCTIVAAICFLLLPIMELNNKRPLFNLRLFRKGGFALSMMVTGIYAFAQGESLVILLFYLIPIRGYNALELGESITYYGLPQVITTPLMPKLMELFDLRLIASVGLIGYAISFWMNVNTTSQTGLHQLIPSLILRGLSQPLILPALSSIVTSHAKKEDSRDASLLFNVVVFIFLTCGSGFLKFFQNRRAQFHSSYVNESVSLSNPTTLEYIDKLTQYFLNQGGGEDLARNRAISTISESINTQSDVLGYIDSYYVSGWIVLSAVGLVLLIRKPRSN